MIETGLLITKQNRLLSIAAILDVFETVNKFYTNAGQENPFNITLLNTRDDEYSLMGYECECIDDTAPKDLVLIPAFNTDNIQQAIYENHEFLPWIINQYKTGAEIATFCTGAFLLGATGLLNGKVATTHVDACNGFASAFPAIKLKADKTVTEDGRLYTSGGATSTFHLLLHLIQKYCGADKAVRTAKFFAIDMDRDSQSYFSTFQPFHNHHDELVASAQQKIESNYGDSCTIEEIIKDIPASRRNIVRRFKQVTGITPIEYLQHTRIAAAKKLLEQTDKQMTEVIYTSGYNDPKAFRKIFRKSVGMTPTEYREKFQVS
ncbi:Transcriptional regulator GlxA family, contains an amidase domain and an AraC-type DNA-binding HTH domain [Mucilaginibacter mallensis]|uniref:Transcriptional regulator GlxA family, contains an amidase domain and an AraC-type DNA-binding HTH domain n=1 Tax=Mucilaginibacter mallensis TaxID=652787 RepID=A0A1H1VYM0_MUCMA|nr:helix-turn-helix domain-containing protein [Mucilaginibacter mallensis]SDS89540.1 Transcriptional regulator GlxA family, contains an amidase domain and an AraC-type DNA-binding HTH domain [Mucilaginibacter mallensis]